MGCVGAGCYAVDSGSEGLSWRISRLSGGGSKVAWVGASLLARSSKTSLLPLFHISIQFSALCLRLPSARSYVVILAVFRQVRLNCGVACLSVFRPFLFPSSLVSLGVFFVVLAHVCLRRVTFSPPSVCLLYGCSLSYCGLGIHHVNFGVFLTRRARLVLFLGLVVIVPLSFCTMAGGAVGGAGSFSLATRRLRRGCCLFMFPLIFSVSGVFVRRGLPEGVLGMALFVSVFLALSVSGVRLDHALPHGVLGLFVTCSHFFGVFAPGIAFFGVFHRRASAFLIAVVLYLFKGVRYRPSSLISLSVPAPFSLSLR